MSVTTINMKEYSKKYYQEHRDEILKKKKKYDSEHKLEKYEYQKERMKDPEVRQRRNERHKARLKERMKDPEFRKKVNENRKKSIKNRIEKDPDYVKKLKEDRRKHYLKNREKQIKNSIEKYYKNRDEKKKNMKEYQNQTKFYGAAPISMLYSRWYRKYRKFISLMNYFTVMKTSDESLRRSIMIRLGHGTINEDEAVHLSGQNLNEEDLKLINSYDYCKIS